MVPVCSAKFFPEVLTAAAFTSLKFEEPIDESAGSNDVFSCHLNLPSLLLINEVPHPLVVVNKELAIMLLLSPIPLAPETSE